MEFNLPDRIPAHITRIIDLALTELDAGRYHAVASHLEEAHRAAEAIQNKAAFLAVHHLKGTLALHRGDLPMALQEHRHVLSYSEQLAIPLGIASASHNVGIIAGKLGKRNEARRFLHQAIEHYVQLGKIEAAERVRHSLRVLDEKPAD